MSRKKNKKTEEEILGGRYEHVADIDRDHRVALVKNKDTGEIFAKKTLSANKKAGYDLIKAARLHGVPRIEEMFEDGNSLYVIEEYIEGTPLMDIMAARDLTLAETIKTVCGICDLLSPLHGLTPPIIHGDLNPNNILVGDDGEIHIVDLSAPQQVAGETPDPFLDIRAVGFILKAFSHGGPKRELTSDRKLGEQMSHIIDRCTSKVPDERYKTVLELKSDLLAMEPMSASDVLKVQVAAGAKNFAPPGFRTRRPWKMIVGVLAYFLMFIVAFNIDFGAKTGGQDMCERLFCFAAFICAALFAMDYLGAHSQMPFSSSDKPGLRIFGIILWTIVIFLVVMSVGGLISLIFA
jgi:hypothetical protein